MRVTNLMMTNNALYNLQRQEQRLNKLDQQYTTQKKISAPSEDPIVATRALKLNTTYAEVYQYVDKNIPDATAWMSMTQSALSNVSSILQSVYEKCVQGNADKLSDTDRNAIATTLSELRDQIYQEGTSSYGGRYLFTGFKTDTNLVFASDSTDCYTITEDMTADNLSTVSTIVNQVSEESTTAGVVPTKVEFNRLRFAYDTTDTGVTPTIKDKDGNALLTVTKSYDTYAQFINDYQMNSLDKNAVVYIADKGELILGDNAAAKVKTTSEFSVTYQKTGFKAEDLRPEHYFTCHRIVDKGLATEKEYDYESTNQEIKYLVNYNQQMTVNVQAKNCFTHDMGRDIDELVDIVNDAIDAEDKMNVLKDKMNSSTQGTAQYNSYKDLYEQAQIEYQLKTKLMQETFASNETGFKNYTTAFSNQATDVGAREQRLDLIKTRLENQLADVEELQSDNIDVDLSDIIARYTSAYDVYQAALSATSKSITQTLLDYL